MITLTLRTGDQAKRAESIRFRAKSRSLRKLIPDSKLVTTSIALRSIKNFKANFKMSSDKLRNLRLCLKFLKYQ